MEAQAGVALVELSRVGNKYEASALAAIRAVNEFDIRTESDYELAVDEARSLATKLAAIVVQEKKITMPLHAAHVAALDLFRGPKSLIEQGIGIWKAKCLAFRKAVDEKAATERIEAEKKAEAERKRLADEAAAVRAKADKEAQELRNAEAERQAIAQREVDRLATVAAEAKKNGDAEAAANAEIAALEISDANAEAARRVAAQVENVQQSGLFAADAIDATRAVVTAATSAVVVKKGTGASIATDYVGEVDDIVKFIKFVAANVDAHPDYAALLNPDNIVLKRHVAAKGIHLNFDGVKVGERAQMRLRKK